MTPSQSHHLATLNARFVRENNVKYPNGQAEHTGNLWELTPLELIRNAKEEVIDQWNFLCTLEDQLIEAETMKPHHGA